MVVGFAAVVTLPRTQGVACFGREVGFRRHDVDGGGVDRVVVGEFVLVLIDRSKNESQNSCWAICSRESGSGGATERTEMCRMLFGFIRAGGVVTFATLRKRDCESHRPGSTMASKARADVNCEG